MYFKYTYPSQNDPKHVHVWIPENWNASAEMCHVSLLGFF